MKLSTLLSKITSINQLHTDNEITGLTLDSRKVSQGDIFFACHGTHRDGRQFIQDAILKGASAILVESDATEIQNEKNIPIIPVKNLQQKIGLIASEFFHSPSEKLHVIGVTGTNGKTSCTHFIASALQEIGVACAVIGTLGNGLLHSIEPSQLTTPEAVSLQSMLANFLKQNIEAVAMEVSSHGLEQGRVNGVKFDVAIFTNLTRDHLDYHQTMEAYGAEKKKLFTQCAPRFSVINLDDPFGAALADELSGSSVFTYSTTPPEHKTNAIYVDDIQTDRHGMKASVVTPWGDGQLIVPLIGQFNLSNILAVLTTLCLLEVPLEKALLSLSHLKSVPGRMQTLTANNRPLVVVDYAHTPDALEKVLAALRQHSQGKLHCLFGCGGDRDRGKRPLMAKIAEQYADHIIVTDDNPRTEDPKQIVADILQGFRDTNAIKIQHDRAHAIQCIIRMANPEDCVLIAGKGAEMYQQIGEEKIPFSDVEKVQAELLLCAQK